MFFRMQVRRSKRRRFGRVLRVFPRGKEVVRGRNGDRVQAEHGEEDAGARRLQAARKEVNRLTRQTLQQMQSNALFESFFVGGEQVAQSCISPNDTPPNPLSSARDIIVY